jgi:hypothetical protein
MLEHNDLSRTLARKRVTVSDYPDGRLVISYNGTPLPYSIFDSVRQVDQAAIVDNKRLSAALKHIQDQQQQRLQYRSRRGPRRSDQAEPLFAEGSTIRAETPATATGESTAATTSSVLRR